MKQGKPVEEVQRTLVRVLAEERISVTGVGTPVPSPPSPLNSVIMREVERLTQEFWPGTPVIPTMLAAATDGSFLRNSGIPTYGHSGRGGEISENRAHGKDERILIKSFFEGSEYLYRLVKALSSGGR